MGWGGHVNVPCTSYIIVCYAAEISGIVAKLLVTTLLGSLGSLLCYLLLRCWDLWDRCYVTCYYAAEISGIVATLLVTTLLGSLGSLLRYLLLRCLAMEMHSQECWLPADNGACVAAMTVKRQKTRLKFFQVSKTSNKRGTVVKFQFLDTKCTSMSTVSGPAGCMCIYIYVHITSSPYHISRRYRFYIYRCIYIYTHTTYPMEYCMNIFTYLHICIYKLYIYIYTHTHIYMYTYMHTQYIMITCKKK